jgi:hypothetical protein
MSNAVFSTIFQDPNTKNLIGIIRKEAGGGFSVYRGPLSDPPAFTDVPDSVLAENLVTAGSYDLALEIYRQALLENKKSQAHS